MAFVRVERRDDGVAVVVLDRPKVNALSGAMLDELADAAGALTADPPGAVVVTGAGRSFAAGADIAEFLAPSAADGETVLVGTEGARAVAGRFRRALDAVASIPRPVIASVAGYALGGGCELALACDLRMAADTARLGQPEILLGIIPGAGGTQRLTRLVGPSRAKDLIFSGRQVTAQEALAMGLVDRVAPAADLLDRATAWAAELAGGPARALALAKRAVDDGIAMPLPEGLALEQELFAEVFGTADARAGIRSFLEHGPGRAGFTGR